MRWILLLSALALAGCTHLKGVVVEDPSGRPAKNAVLSIGRPGGISVYDQHHVDAHGAFDFYVGPTDENNIYLFDSAGNTELTLRHVDSYEISQNMKLHIRPAAPYNPALPVDTNINP